MMVDFLAMEGCPSKTLHTRNGNEKKPQGLCSPTLLIHICVCLHCFYLSLCLQTDTQ